MDVDGKVQLELVVSAKAMSITRDGSVGSGKAGMGAGTGLVNVRVDLRTAEVSVGAKIGKLLCVNVLPVAINTAGGVPPPTKVLTAPLTVAGLMTNELCCVFGAAGLPQDNVVVGVVTAGPEVNVALVKIDDKV